MSAVVVTDEATIAKLQAVLDAASSACKGDAGDTLATLVGALATFCAQRKGAVRLFDVAIDALTASRAILQQADAMTAASKPLPS